MLPYGCLSYFSISSEDPSTTWRVTFWPWINVLRVCERNCSCFLAFSPSLSSSASLWGGARNWRQYGANFCWSFYVLKLSVLLSVKQKRSRLYRKYSDLHRWMKKFLPRVVRENPINWQFTESKVVYFKFCSLLDTFHGHIHVILLHLTRYCLCSSILLDQTHKSQVQLISTTIS
jgi:hypothetical protein